MSREMTTIGYWRQKEGVKEDSLPFPIPTEGLTIMEMEFVRRLKQLEQKEARAMHCKGFSICRLCGKTNGSIEYKFKLGKVVYVWPEGYKHYVEEHGVTPDADFMQAVLKHFKAV